MTNQPCEQTVGVRSLKLKKKHQSAIAVALVVIIASLSTGLFFAYAGQENHLSEDCEHSYSVAAFKAGVVTFKCTKCGGSYREVFAKHINERNYAPLDVVEDGIVNAKDYAKLKRLAKAAESGGGSMLDNITDDTFDDDNP